MACRHGLALALAVTDDDIESDAVADDASDALGEMVPERELDEHAD